jgi:hypothetical protein
MQAVVLLPSLALLRVGETINIEDRGLAHAGSLAGFSLISR